MTVTVKGISGIAVQILGIHSMRELPSLSWSEICCDLAKSYRSSGPLPCLQSAKYGPWLLPGIVAATAVQSSETVGPLSEFWGFGD